MSEKIYYQTPRLIQIICLLYYLEGYKEEYGLILEVLTGEGKTLTISFLALYLSILGKKVDILTSSPVLAERDAKNRKKLFNSFEISCDYCRNDSNKNKENMFECYNADIVYGDGISLIGDILRSNFMEKKGRGNRPFDYIIIDEIDNICIDNLRNIVELNDNCPGFKYLEFVYLFIYKALKKKADKFKSIHKKKLKKKELKKEAELVLHEVSKETRIFLQNNKKLKDDDTQKILIPKNSYDFINIRIDHWSKMAYEAMFNFEKNKNYFISEDKNIGFERIKPIDYENTGVILQNSEWSGLHQFLQIKEGLIFTAENINSSFMSYLSFFRKYKQIYGISGTLGSKKTQQAINKIYNIKLLRIPPFKTRRLMLYEPQTFSDKEEYKKQLISQIIEFSVNSKRVVLVLFEYIRQVTEMYDFLKEKKKEYSLQDTKIISYIRSDINNDFLEKEMVPNTIILSTNLGGRGTDIKINSEVKKNGGLHVIITFMPYNERTEKQAQGRAGRCGDQGSSITMILANNNYKTLESRRTKYELEKYKFLINLYSPQLDLNQRFFEEYCKKIQQITIKGENEDIIESIILDIKERWSMFILKNNINSFMNDLIHPNVAGQIYKLYERISTKNFNALMKQIDVDLKDYKFHNPFYQMKSNLPIEMYDSAIKKSPEFSFGAYYNRAYSNIINKNKNYQIVVYNDLKIMRNLCYKFIHQFQEYINMFTEIHKDEDDDDEQNCSYETDDSNDLSNNIRENNYKNSQYINQCYEKINVMKRILNNVNQNLSKILNVDEKKMEYDLNKFEENLIYNSKKDHEQFLDIK